MQERGRLERGFSFLQTIENTRVRDETMVADEDEELLAEECDDEFAGRTLSSACHLAQMNAPFEMRRANSESSCYKELLPADYFDRTSPPNVLITTNYKPSAVMFALIADMLTVFPKATYYKRQVRYPFGSTLTISTLELAAATTKLLLAPSHS